MSSVSIGSLSYQSVYKFGSGPQEIVGGRDARIEDFPWQVELIYGYGNHLCGGTLISPNWVLTAAHCLENYSVAYAYVVAGITNRSEVDTPVAQVRNVVRVINHPKYDSQLLRYDAALLELDEPIDVSGPRARTIPMITEEMAKTGMVDPGVDVTVTGWGVTSEGSREVSEILQQVTVPIVDSEAALKFYGPDWIFPEIIAAGLMGVGGKDACSGDSGGPMIAKGPDGAFVLAGIVSEGYGCARKNYPGLYTRVSSVQKWVMDVILQPVPCGTRTCTDGAVCCHALCGLCAPPGVACGTLDCMPPLPDDPR